MSMALFRRLRKQRDSLNAPLVKITTNRKERKREGEKILLKKIKYGKNSAYLIRLEIFWHETVVLILQGFVKTKSTFTLEIFSSEKSDAAAKTFGTFCMTFNENEIFSK